MTILSRFVDEAEQRASVAGCPLASLPASRDESACAGCRYNVLWPGRASIGCATLTPADVFEGAVARLRARDPRLADELSALRDVRVVDPEHAARWLRLVDAWGSDLDEREREVASVAARFAYAAQKLDAPVTIFGAR